jgi:hypothetical protein
MENDGPKDFFETFHFAASFDFENSFPNYDFFNGFENQIEINGNKSLQINSENEYNLTFHDTIRKLNMNKPLRVMLTADFYQQDTSKIQLVLQYNDYYQAHFTENTLTETYSSVTKNYKWEISKEKLKENQELKVYLWNQNKKSVNIDNYNLIIYQ